MSDNPAYVSIEFNHKLHSIVFLQYNGNEKELSQFINFLTEYRRSESEIRVSEMRFSAAQIAMFVTFARTYFHDLDAMWLLSGSIVIQPNPYHLPFDEWWDNFLGSYVQPNWSRVAEKVERLY